MANDGKWQPGQSGNPNGRPPKGECLTDLLKQKLDKDKFIAKVIELAEAGDTTCIRYIWERIEGKIPEHIGIGGTDNGPLKWEILIKEIDSDNDTIK